MEKAAEGKNRTEENVSPLKGRRGLGREPGRVRLDSKHKEDRVISNTPVITLNIAGQNLPVKRC